MDKRNGEKEELQTPRLYSRGSVKSIKQVQTHIQLAYSFKTCGLHSGHVCYRYINSSHRHDHCPQGGDSLVWESMPKHGLWLGFPPLICCSSVYVCKMMLFVALQNTEKKEVEVDF
jgi:hypothetical protein